MYKYSVEIYINNQWVIEYRYYYEKKELDDFDLIPVKDKRRNPQFIEFIK